MAKNKLTIELIPKTCWFSSVRTTVRPKDWDMIRFISYEAAGHKCEICGDTGKNQGYGHNVECHEIWEYDDIYFVQRLAGLISLCVRCHQVKHIGRAIRLGKLNECVKHLAKVNKWTKEEIDAHLEESFDTYKQRSKFEWTLDLSILNEEPYNLKINTKKARVFEVKKYKKKRKPKKKAVAKKTTAKKVINKRPAKKR